MDTQSQREQLERQMAKHAEAMKLAEEDSHSDTRTNRLKLERECERQSTLYLRYSDLLADIRDDENKADDLLDRVLGEVELSYRDNPPENVKVTDSTIKALVAKDDLVDACKEILRKAKLWRYRLEGIVKSLEHKKSEIDNLVVLWSKGYYMVDTGMPRSGLDEASDAIRNQMNKGDER
jgi:hypothetical protein